MLKHAIVMEESTCMVDSTDDLSRLLIPSREQNGRDKIDGPSRPREPRTWTLGKWTETNKSAAAASPTLKLKRPPRLSLARPITSEEQHDKRQQRRGQHWDKLPLHSATVQHATEKSLKTAIGGASDTAALPTYQLPSPVDLYRWPTASEINRLGPGLHSLAL